MRRDADSYEVRFGGDLSILRCYLHPLPFAEFLAVTERGEAGVLAEDLGEVFGRTETGGFRYLGNAEVGLG